MCVCVGVGCSSGGGGEAFAFVSECRTFISQWKLIEFGQLAPDECTSNEVNERNGGDMFCKLISKKITIQIELSPPILPEKKTIADYELVEQGKTKLEICHEFCRIYYDCIALTSYR